jgi:hypothetical protein
MECNNCNKEIYLDGSSWYHSHSKRKICGDIAEPKKREIPKVDINVCPNCGGVADNGHDRCYPPNPYFCTKCDSSKSKIDAQVLSNALYDAIKYESEDSVNDFMRILVDEFSKYTNEETK